MIHKHSAGGIILENGKVLTISWTDREHVGFPKGGIDEGETSEQAALREVYEETGYRARILAPLKSWTYEFDREGELCRKTVDYYLMERVDDAEPTPHREPGEVFENLWLDIDEARRRLTFEDARGAFDEALNATIRAVNKEK